MKRYLYVLIPLAIFACIGSFLPFVWCRNGQPCECNYKKIKIGMTLDEVEAVLGPGEEIRKEQVPTTPKEGSATPVVQGDRFFYWGDARTEIHIGFKDGIVYDKDYCEYSL